MQKRPPAPNPDAYVAALDGWRRECVESLRAAVLTTCSDLDELIKWGHLVYLLGGRPILLIRAEEHRVLFGFWRGKRLTGIEPRLKPGGKYELATVDLREGMTVEASTARRLTLEAVELDRQLGDPRSIAKADSPADRS